MSDLAPHSRHTTLKRLKLFLRKITIPKLTLPCSPEQFCETTFITISLRRFSLSSRSASTRRAGLRLPASLKQNMIMRTMKQLTRKDVLEIASLDLLSTVSIPALTLPFRDIYASPCQELRHAMACPSLPYPSCSVTRSPVGASSRSDAFLNGLNFSSREILCRQLRTKFRVGTLANIHLTFVL